MVDSLYSVLFLNFQLTGVSSQDPADSSLDTDREYGSILSAILKFPVDYTFHVVGKTEGDDDVTNSFVEDVKAVVQEMITVNDDEVTVTPRGSKFTKVSVQAQVESSDMISTIYAKLGDLELSVMRF